MSAIPLDKVHGDHLHRQKPTQSVSINAYQITLKQLSAKHGIAPSEIRLFQIDGVPVYQVGKVGQKPSQIYSGITGDIVGSMPVERIKTAAQSLFSGEEGITSAQLIKKIPLEASKLSAPVWQVLFDDSIGTTFYLHPVSAELLMVRSDIWRLFDFVWMLHIMDYQTRDDFNNPLLITFAASALIFTLSGIFLLFQVFKRRDFRLSKRLQQL